MRIDKWMGCFKMINERTLNRYRLEIQRIGLDEAIRVSELPTNAWREIKEALGITTNKKSSVLAQQRILKRVVREIREEQPNQEILQIAEQEFGIQQVRELRHEIENERQALQDELNRIRELREQAEREREELERQIEQQRIEMEKQMKEELEKQKQDLLKQMQEELERQKQELLNQMQEELKKQIPQEKEETKEENKKRQKMSQEEEIMQMLDRMDYTTNALDRWSNSLFGHDFNAPMDLIQEEKFYTNETAYDFDQYFNAKYREEMLREIGWSKLASEAKDYTEGRKYSLYHTNIAKTNLERIIGKLNKKAKEWVKNDLEYMQNANEFINLDIEAEKEWIYKKIFKEYQDFITQEGLEEDEDEDENESEENENEDESEDESEDENEDLGLEYENRELGGFGGIDYRLLDPNEFVSRNLDYSITASDGTQIDHFKREINFDSEIEKNEIIASAKMIVNQVYDEMKKFVKDHEYCKIYINLVSENGQGVSKSMSNGFIKKSDLDIEELLDLIADTAMQETSGTRNSSITFNITGF